MCSCMLALSYPSLMTQTSSKKFLVTFTLGLVSGTVNSIVMKLCYQTAALGLADENHFFHKPWFMSLLMFFAMLCALPLYFLTKRKSSQNEAKHKESMNSADHIYSIKTWLIVSIPSACDLIGSSMQQIGLIFTPVSIYQMLKGSILLFSAALSVMFLHKRMYRHNWVGVVLCVIALSLVGVSSVMAVEEQPVVVSIKESLFGISIVIVGQVVCAAQYVLEEFLLKPPNDVSAMAMVGMEGAWGTILMSCILLPLFQYTVRGSDVGGVYENTRDTFAMIDQSSTLQTLLTVAFFATLVYNICGVMVTQQASAVHHTFLDATRTIFVWIASVTIFYWPNGDGSLGEPLTKWSILEFIGFALLLLGECMYDGLIPLPEMWQKRNERIDPMMSPVRIPSLNPSPNGQTDSLLFDSLRDPLLELKIDGKL